MIKQFERLSIEERSLLLKAPVLLSVLASNSYDEVNGLQKTDAIKLAHLKTFTAIPLLIPYYVEVEKNFKKKFENTVKEYFPTDEPERIRLKEEIQKVYLILEKLDKGYAYELQRSLGKYSRHVEKATHSVLQDFIFPMPIPGLTD